MPNPYLAYTPPFIHIFLLITWLWVKNINCTFLDCFKKNKKGIIYQKSVKTIENKNQIANRPMLSRQN